MINPPACIDCAHCIVAPRGDDKKSYTCKINGGNCHDERLTGACGPAGAEWVKKESTQ